MSAETTHTDLAFLRQGRAARAVLTGLSGAVRSAVAFYKELHRDPELSGEEEITAARFARRLHDCGFAVTTGLGGHGVAGLLRNGPGPMVGFRAELDGLPIEERTGLSYACPPHRSRMHACGHDAHLAAAAGSAALLAGAKERWQGSLLVIGQPAEETLSGARAMLDDGLYRRLGTPDVLLAQHVGPLPCGTVAHSGTEVMAAVAELRITIRGPGGHGGSRSLANDVLSAAARLVLLVEAARSLGTEPNAPLVSVGAVLAGESANVIPAEAELKLSVRARSAAEVDRCVNRVRELVHTACGKHDGSLSAECTVVRRGPALLNDPAAALRVRRLHRSMLGDRRVLSVLPATSGEDFGHFSSFARNPRPSAGVSTVYWFVGATGAERWRGAPGSTSDKLAALPGCHSPYFAPDPEPTLATAITALVSGAFAYLEPRDASG
ncbi:amidohydrolase [Amycolatopsis sp. NPDC054798]